MFHNGRVLAELTQLRAGMADCLDAPAWALPDADLVDSLGAVHQLEQAVAAVKLHLVREVDARALPVAAHACSTAGWLRERLRVDAGTARPVGQPGQGARSAARVG